MNIQAFFSYFKGKLVRTMLIAMFISLFIFMAVSISFTKFSVEQLNNDLSSDLNTSSETIASSLNSNLSSITNSVGSAKTNASQILSTFLSSRLKEVSKDTEKNLRSALLKSGEVLADTLSKVSVEAILSRKFSTLNSYVKVANKDPNVIYAYFIRPNGKPFTRYVNRKNEKVKAFLSVGQGRSPMDKLLDAAGKDKNIVEVSRPIEFEGKLIATIKVGITIEEVNNKINQLANSFNTLVNDSNQEINKVLDKESTGMLNSLKKGFKKVNKENANATQEVIKQVEKSSFDLLKNLSVMMTIVGFTVVIFLSLFVILKVFRPIQHLTDAMNELGGGEGDLAFRLTEEGNDEFTKVAIGFNQFVSKIELLVAELSVKTSNLESLVSDVSNSAKHSSKGMKKQKEETVKIATSVSELTSIVQDVTEKTLNAADDAKEADQLSEQGIVVVGQTVDKIEELAKAVQNAGQVIQRVEEDTKQISTILDVIRGIAEQTNLLALNAAIEAARAGEQGRGFAVVADEVRTLAQRSHESTEEIQTMINSLQTGVSEAVKVMSDSQECAIDGVSDAKQAGIALADIKKSIDMISTMNIQIADSARQQQSLTEEVNQGTVNIADVANQTNQDAEATSTATTNMAGMVEQLLVLVGNFHMEGNAVYEQLKTEENNLT